MTLQELSQQLGLGSLLAEINSRSGGYDLSQLDGPPVPGDFVDGAGFRLTVLEVRDRRIRRLRGTPLPPEAEDDSDQG